MESEPKVQIADPDASLRTMKIVTGAMVAGVVVFLLVALLAIRSGKMLAQDPWDLADPLVLVGAVMALAAIPASVFVPDAITRPAALKALETAEKPARKPGKFASRPDSADWGPDAGRLIPFFQTRTIVRGALLEGAAFFNTIAYMQTGSGIALGFVALLIALLVANIPTENRLLLWIDGIRGDTDLA